jgi:pyruvate/2-oxoglutarate/acetoin dehydrogenase E1 component
MSQPEYTPYKDALTKAMGEISKKDNSIFIGQQIVYRGNPMSTTLDDVDVNKMIELPVMEETQMGMSLGLAMTDKLVVTFYPRWDFILSAANQMINHLDKYELMTGVKPHVLIRLGKGSDKPLDPGHQHKGNYFEEFKNMCKGIEFHDLKTPSDIELSYKYAMDNKGVHCLVEYPELYYVS